ncbi:MAG: hypothetical protein OXB88_05100, partial [Bacteriovoracales bacterium]|nr:hypothetical protein [Bacteriovoracales bacterium]
KGRVRDLAQDQKSDSRVFVPKKQPGPKTYQWPLSKSQDQKEIKEKEDKTLTKKSLPQPYKNRDQDQVLGLAQDQKSDSRVFAPKKQPGPKTYQWPLSKSQDQKEIKEREDKTLTKKLQSPMESGSQKDQPGPSQSFWGKSEFHKKSPTPKMHPQSKAYQSAFSKTQSQEEEKGREEKKSPSRINRFLSSLNFIQNSKKKSVFRIGNVFDSLLGLNDSNVVIISSVQPTLGMDLKQKWGNSLIGVFGFDFIMKSYQENSIENNKFLKNREETQINMHFGVEYLWKDSTVFSLNMGIVDSFYYRQDNEDIYSIRKEKTPELKFKISHQVAKLNSWSLSATGQVKSLQKGTEYFKGGPGYGLGLDLKFLMKNSALSGKTLYQQSQLKADWGEFEHRVLDFIIEYETGF